jgi:hypothetical protein
MTQFKLLNGLTRKQDHFAHLIAADENMTASDAYRQAYDTNGNDHTIDVQASRLLAHPVIAPRISELRDEVATYAGITPQAIATKFEQHRTKAIDLEQMGAANAALERQADLLDLFCKRKLSVESKSVTITASLGELTVDDLRQLMAQGVQAQALDSGQPQGADAPASP